MQAPHVLLTEGVGVFYFGYVHSVASGCALKKSSESSLEAPYFDFLCFVYRQIMRRWGTCEQSPLCCPLEEDMDKITGLPTERTYDSKPFSPLELMARVNAQLRYRSPGNAKPNAREASDAGSSRSHGHCRFASFASRFCTIAIPNVFGGRSTTWRRTHGSSHGSSRGSPEI